MGSAGGSLGKRQTDDHDRFRAHALFDEATDFARHDAGARSRLVRALVRVRSSLGLSQRNIAESMGTTQSAVSDIEKGVTDPRLSTLQRYARAIRCRIDFELVDDTRSLERQAIHYRSWHGSRSLSYDDFSAKDVIHQWDSDEMKWAILAAQPADGFGWETPRNVPIEDVRLTKPSSETPW